MKETGIAVAQGKERPRRAPGPSGGSGSQADAQGATKISGGNHPQPTEHFDTIEIVPQFLDQVAFEHVHLQAMHFAPLAGRCDRARRKAAQSLLVKARSCSSAMLISLRTVAAALMAGTPPLV